MTQLLSVEGLTTFASERATIARDVDLRLDQGAHGAILGGSCSGKTALLGAIAGMVQAASGRILIAGREVTREGPRSRRASGLELAFQDPPLIAGLTVSEQVSLALDGRPVEDDRRRQLFRLLPELEEIWRGGVARLPRSARRFVDLARALAARPSLLLIDEIGLDIGIERTMEIVGSLRKNGVTLLIAERFPVPVLEIVDHAWVMSHGRLVIDGRPDALAGDDRVQAACVGDLPPPP